MVKLKENTIKLGENNFVIPPTFVEGFQINIAEADVLNMAAAGKIRNELKKLFKTKPNLSTSEIIYLINEYSRTFTFNTVTVEKFSPTELTTARNLIRTALRNRGSDLKKYTKAQISEAARNYLNTENGYATVQQVLRSNCEQFVAAA
jgi:hypothetical protein